MIEKYPAVVFLFCVCIIISWFAGRSFQREGLHGNERIDLVFSVVSVFGGIFIGASLLVSLIKIIIIAWPK